MGVTALPGSKDTQMLLGKQRWSRILRIFPLSSLAFNGGHFCFMQNLGVDRKFFVRLEAFVRKMERLGLHDVPCCARHF